MAPKFEDGNHVQHQGQRPPGEEVVISGISGIFPNSENTTQFSENLFNKVDMVSKEDLNFQHPEAPKHLGKITGVTKFDAQFFRVTYNHAISMEPMSRKLLEQAYMAMYDSGINPLAYKQKKVGVFVGSSYTDTSNVAMYNQVKQNGFVLSGCGKSMFSNRISYWIDVKGPSYTLDCSCASSMVCLEHAYTAMTKGECEAAIVGGCNLCFEPNLGLNLSRSGFVSLDGKTKCFDKHADGSVRSEAVSCLFLQKAKDAKRIYAEVCFAQVTYGLKEDAQFLPLRRSEDLQKFFNNFYDEAGVSPKEIEYVEADGSAHAEADIDELKAIGEVFANNRQVKVGSVKSNMGNSEPASGVCALTKVCLAYHKGKLPANLHYSQPTDVPALKEGKIQVLQNNQPFNRGYTAVNNFSINGTNCHVLLKGRYKPKDISKYKTNIPRLVLISGRHDDCVNKIVDILKNQPIDPEIIGMLHNIYKIDTPGHTSRGYTILDTNDKNQTVSLAQNANYYSGAKKELWLVFSGMGSQWPGMAADLMKIPIFANAIHKCHKALEPLGVDLIKVLTEPDKTIFDKILNCFIGISAVQIALTDVLKAIGVVPDHVIGHSQGEMGCAYFDDCFTTEEMILAAYSRGYVSAQTEFAKGAMAAVGLGYKDILPLCPPEIDVACHNSNESATLSGPADKLKEFVAELTAKGIFAREVPSANIAFHSRYIAHAGPEFLRRMNDIIKTPKLRSEKWICTSVPQERWHEPLARYSSAEYHTNNLMSPVYFEEASSLIPDNAVVVEVAPHGLLQAILKRSHPECTHIPLTRRGTTDQVKFLFEAIGKLYQEGYNFEMDALYPKIEYPVATETQLLSHYVDWEHSEEFPIVVAHDKDPVTTATRDVIFSIHDDEYKFMTGHIRDGQNVFPESAALYLIWETLSMYLGIKLNKLSVNFRDIQFHTEVILNANQSFKFNIMINKGNDYFEVNHDGVLFVSGYVAQIVKPVIETLKDVDESSNEDIVLHSEDVYEQLHVRGLTYRDEFQTIRNTNFNRTSAQIKWTGNWMTFVDSLIQLNNLSRDYEGVSTPKVIKKLLISVEHHYKEKTKEIDGENYLNAKLYNTYGVTRCGGVEMRHIIFDDKPIKDQLPNVLESQTFVPYCSTSNFDINTALQVTFQIIADNVQKDTINVTELVSGTAEELKNELEKVGEAMPYLNLNVLTLISTKYEINGEPDVIVLNGDLKIDENFKTTNKNPFILIINENFSDFKNGTYNVISSMNVEKKQLVLLKKKETASDDVTFISVNNDEKFSWVAVLESELQKTKRVVLVSERQPHCGLIGLVKELKKEHGGKIGLVIVDDFNAPTFDQRNKMFKEQLQKKLAFNVFKKNEWGSYFYLPCPNSVNVTSFKLVNAPGSEDNLKWSEVPALPASDNLVQVCYAGASIRDSQKAVGLTDDNQDFGLDFSGFDAMGDRIMGFISGGAIASSIEADPELVWPIPAFWTLEEAATIPLPYIHAYYCLVIKAQLLKGQTVFINGGTGALGQAVISICISLGCTVYTSVSDVQKKNFLLELFPELKEENIGCSQNGSFYSMVLLNTKGKRCNFVINTASGAAREAAMKCVAPFGIFMDINSYDSKRNGPFGMSFVENDRTYMNANLSCIFKPENAKEKKMLQALIAQGIINGTIRPLSRLVFPATDISRAFRILSTNKHRGRVLIRVRDGEIPISSLDIVPRVTFSSKGTHVVLCDDSVLGVELANRLVRRGARKLLLHLKSKNVSGYLHTKLASWMKLGTKVKINTDNLNTDDNCVQLLKEAEKLGRVHGVFIVNESSITKRSIKVEEFVEKHKNINLVVSRLDVVTRNNCPEISNFVIVSRASNNAVDEHTTSVCDKICEARLNVGLPALSLKVELLDELNATNEHEKLKPQTVTTALNALEMCLKQKQTSVITYDLKRRKHAEFLRKAAVCLGIHSLDYVTNTLTVSDFIANEVNIEQLKKLIKETFKLDYTIENLRDFTIASLKALSKHQDIKQSNKFDSGLQAFYTFVDQDEFLATDVMVPMRTIVDSSNRNEANELDGTATHLMLIPGFEGHHQIFKPICERLKIKAMTFQLGPDLVNCDIKDMAQHVLKYIKKTFVFKSKFYLMGYSFGVNIALEVAALLEKEGHIGIVYCLDSSPDVIKLQLDAYIGKQTATDLENLIIEHMYKIMTSQEDQKLTNQIKDLDNWSDKVDAGIKAVNKTVPYTKEYIRNVLDSAYKRLLLVRDYKPQLKLKSKLVLLKGTPHPNMERFDEDYGLSKYSAEPIEVFNIVADHATAPQDCRVSNIVNKLLDPELLEEFKHLNLCDSYYANC